MIDDASVFETDTGTATLILPVRFVGAQPNTVTGTTSAIPLTAAGFSPATGGAACGGSVDFESFNNVPFSIPPNTPNGTLSVNIRICPDAVIEPNEHIFVSLDNVSGAVCLEGTCNGVGTIRNNDGPPTISINNVSVREPIIRGDSRTVAFTVSLSHPRPTDVSVNFATRNGTAVSGGTFPDYRSRSGTVTIPGNQSLLAGSAVVTILGDQVSEPSQTFFVDLSAPSNGSILDGLGQATIQDNTLAFPTGTFELSPVDEKVAAGETIPFVAVWTVPDGEVWRDLSTIDFRIRRGNSMALWVRWDETTNEFSLCEGAGKKNDDNNGSSLDAVCVPGGLAGTPVVLQTAFGRLDLANSSVVGSGPTGQSVALNLSITPGDDAAGQYQIELAASDRFGNVDDLTSVGQLLVKPVQAGK